MNIFRTVAVIVLALLLLSCAAAAEQPSITLEEFFDRRDTCDHLRGEFPDPPDPERVKEVLNGIREYCTGTDAQLAALKVRYANNPAIMKRLNEYEPGIEQRKERKKRQ